MSAPSAPQPLSHVLVATDFSKGADSALKRALLLPLAKDALFHILHVMPANNDRSEAVATATEGLAELAAQVRSELRGRTRKVTTEVLSGDAFVEIIRRSRSLRAELVILGRHGRRSIREMFIGTTAERVIRKGDVPVLVVNGRPSHPYRRPLIATDLDDTCQRAVEMAVRIVGAGVGRFSVVHAYHVPFEGFISPTAGGQKNSDWRREFHDSARRELASFLTRHDHAAVQWQPSVRQGDPRSAVLAEARRLRADVIAVGTHGRSGLAHALLGSVAEWIITAATSDVLVARPEKLSLELP